MKSFRQFLEEQQTGGGPPGGFPEDLPDFPEEDMYDTINDDGTWTSGGYTWYIRDGQLYVYIDGEWYLRAGVLDNTGEGEEEEYDQGHGVSYDDQIQMLIDILRQAGYTDKEIREILGGAIPLEPQSDPDDPFGIKDDPDYDPNVDGIPPWWDQPNNPPPALPDGSTPVYLPNGPYGPGWYHDDEATPILPEDYGPGVMTIYGPSGVPSGVAAMPPSTPSLTPNVKGGGPK